MRKIGSKKSKSAYRKIKRAHTRAPPLSTAEFSDAGKSLFDDKKKDGERAFEKNIQKEC